MNSPLSFGEVALDFTLPAILMTDAEIRFVVGHCDEHNVSLGEFARAALLEAAQR